MAGLEPGGIHHQILNQLDLPLPEATPCDPACAVFLPEDETPIRVWRDQSAWQAERERQFPGSEKILAAFAPFVSSELEVPGPATSSPPPHPLGPVAIHAGCAS